MKSLAVTMMSPYRRDKVTVTKSEENKTDRKKTTKLFLNEKISLGSIMLEIKKVCVVKWNMFSNILR